MAKKIKSVTMKISVKLRDAILIQKASAETQLKNMGVNAKISKVLASDILAKRVKSKLK